MGGEHSKEAQTGRDETSQTPSTKSPEASKVVEEVTNPIVLNLSAEGIDALPQNEKNLVSLFLTHSPCEGFSMKQVKALTSCRNLQVLDLSNNAIKTELSFLSELKNLKVINLFNNEIININFSNELLETVDLGFNLITQFPELPRTIVNVNLDHNFLTMIDYPQGESLDFKNLQKLSMSYNKIGVINQNFRFNSLTVLNLSHNNLAGLPDLTVFAPRVRQLDISHNKIPVLPNLPRTLVFLDAKDNKLRNLPKTLSQLSYLLHLDVSHNFIKQVPQLPVSIQTLFLNDNVIESIAPSNLPDIVRIYAFNNRLTEFPQIVGSSLVEYHLAGNLINAITTVTFGKSTTKIDLSRNQIQHFPEEFFQLPQLAILLLSHNKIEEFPPVSGSLNVLDLSYNPLTNVPELSRGIECLYLTGCGLTELPAQLSELPDLLTLDVSENKLSDIPELPILRHLNISANSFTKLPKLPESLRYLNISENQISALPKNFSQPNLRVFDASWADIRVFPKESNLPNLEILKIQGNPIISQIPISKMPKLIHIDISSTQAHFDEESLSVNTTVVCSEPTLFKSKQFRLIPSINSKYGYSTSLGKLNLEEDPILMRPDFFRGVDVLASVSAEDGEGSDAVFKLATGLLLFDDVFDIKNINYIISKMDAHFLKINSRLPPFVLILKKDRECLIASSGGYGAIAVGKNGSRELLIEDKSDLGVHRIAAKGFNEPSSTNFRITKFALDRADKYVVGMSSSMVRAVGIDGASEAAAEAQSARALALALTRLAVAQCADNISVVACEL